MSTRAARRPVRKASGQSTAGASSRIGCAAAGHRRAGTVGAAVLSRTVSRGGSRVTSGTGSSLQLAHQQLDRLPADLLGGHRHRGQPGLRPVRRPRPGRSPPPTCPRGTRRPSVAQAAEHRPDRRLVVHHQPGQVRVPVEQRGQLATDRRRRSPRRAGDRRDAVPVGGLGDPGAGAVGEAGAPLVDGRRGAEQRDPPVPQPGQVFHAQLRRPGGSPGRRRSARSGRRGSRSARWAGQLPQQRHPGVVQLDVHHAAARRPWRCRRSGAARPAPRRR